MEHQHKLEAHLKELIQGLWLPSETEAPWTVPTWKLEAVTADQIRQGLRREQTAPVNEIRPETLMAQVNNRCRGYGAEGQTIAQQHRQLMDFLQTTCDRVQVFRVGEVTVDIVVVGETDSTHLILQTQSVET